MENPVALTSGTWAHPRTIIDAICFMFPTIIDAICFMFPKQEHTVYLGQQNSFRSTAKSPSESTHGRIENRNSHCGGDHEREDPPKIAPHSP